MKNFIDSGADRKIEKKSERRERVLLVVDAKNNTQVNQMENARLAENALN